MMTFYDVSPRFAHFRKPSWRMFARWSEWSEWRCNAALGVPGALLKGKSLQQLQRSLFWWGDDRLCSESSGYFDSVDANRVLKCFWSIIPVLIFCYILFSCALEVSFWHGDSGLLLIVSMIGNRWLVVVCDCLTCLINDSLRWLWWWMMLYELMNHKMMNDVVIFNDGYGKWWFFVHKPHIQPSFAIVNQWINPIILNHWAINHVDRPSPTNHDSQPQSPTIIMMIESH